MKQSTVPIIICLILLLILSILTSIYFTGYTNTKKALNTCSTNLKVLRDTKANLGMEIIGLQDLIRQPNKINNKDNVLKYLLRHSVIDRETLKVILNEVEKTTNPLLLLAIFKKESHYNPYAESKKGAIGLGQIMPIHVKELKKAGIKLETKRDLFNIKNNVQATEYLIIKFMKKANNDIYKMLRYYYGIHNNKYFIPVIANYFHLKMLTNAN